MSSSIPSSIRVSSVMHRGVIACRPELPALAVARIMAAHRIHSVVVEGVPAAVITDSELAAALCEDGLATMTAGEIARAAVVVAPDDPVARATELMVECATTHAVVVDELAQRAVGVISVLDVAETLVQPTPGP